MSAANEISMGHLEGLLRAIFCSLASKISVEASEWLDEEGRVPRMVEETGGCVDHVKCERTSKQDD